MKTLLLSLACIVGVASSAHAEFFQPRVNREIVVAAPVYHQAPAYGVRAPVEVYAPAVRVVERPVYAVPARIVERPAVVVEPGRGVYCAPESRIVYAAPRHDYYWRRY